ncbi:hypothetical protein TgHK011_008445 [Trichoderma gracile]|nr:hypothetical protein TgHK011_008445 [Trichoderma gracile]
MHLWARDAPFAYRLTSSGGSACLIERQRFPLSLHGTLHRQAPADYSRHPRELPAPSATIAVIWGAGTFNRLDDAPSPRPSPALPRFSQRSARIVIRLHPHRRKRRRHEIEAETTYDTLALFPTIAAREGYQGETACGRRDSFPPTSSQPTTLPNDQHPPSMPRPSALLFTSTGG